MKAPLNRKVFVIGYALSTPLGHGLEKTWDQGIQGESGIRAITRFDPGDYPVKVAGEIPDYNPSLYPFLSSRELSKWDSLSTPMVMSLCWDAINHAQIEISGEDKKRTGIIIGSALNGLDAYEKAAKNYHQGGSNKVSPMLLPNYCGNVPAGMAGKALGIHGPIYAPGSACASGNHAVAEAARVIQTGKADVMLAGAFDFPLLPPIVCGFGNMNALIKEKSSDRAYLKPPLSSRPFSGDRRGFVLSEGAAVLVLAAEEWIKSHGVKTLAEIVGVGMTSDAYHFTNPNPSTIIMCLKECLEDAQLSPHDIQLVNTHGTSTKVGDEVEVLCLQEVFGKNLEQIKMTANKSQLGHSLGAAPAIESILSIEGMKRNLVLPTLNYLADPLWPNLNVVTEVRQEFEQEFVLNNSFGFGGTNCCLIFRNSSLE